MMLCREGWWDCKLLEHLRMVIYQCPSNLKFLTIQSGNYASRHQQCCPEMAVTLFTEALPGKGRNRNQPAGQQSRKASTSVDVFTLWNRTEPKTRRAWPHLRVKPKESRSWSRYSWLLGVNYSSPLTGRYSSLANTTVMHGLLLVELYSDQPPSPTFPHSSRANCTCLKKPQR